LTVKPLVREAAFLVVIAVGSPACFLARFDDGMTAKHHPNRPEKTSDLTGLRVAKTVPPDAYKLRKKIFKFA
jgi:hypothetical protein